VTSERKPIPVHARPSRPQHPAAIGRTALGAALLSLLSMLPGGAARAEEPAAQALDGRAIMDEVLRRHEQFPYTLERQTLILVDAAGKRNTRKLRRLSRVESDGSLKFLLVFDNPPEVRGTALLATRNSGEALLSEMYLPAFGPVMIGASGDPRGNRFLGTDFALEDLTAELSTDFRYRRGDDRELEGIPGFTVDAYPLDESISKATGYGRKRHFIRRDIFFVTRTDYFDRNDRLVKRQTRHDLKRVDGNMWRADMVLMEDYRQQHKTLLKTEQRIFSRDYVPPELFTAAALLEHRHLPGDGRPPVVREQAEDLNTGGS
jgi:hypothetical protein